MSVRMVSDRVGVIEVGAEVTSASEASLGAAYSRASGSGSETVILDFTDMEYLTGGGIGVLVMTLISARQQGKRLVACGLSSHYRAIFSVTRLDEAIAVHADKSAAVFASRSTENDLDD